MTVHHEYKTIVVAFSANQARIVCERLKLQRNHCSYAYDIGNIKGMRSYNLVLVDGWEKSPNYDHAFIHHIKFIVETSQQCDIFIERVTL